jgi:hypothetical protein
LNLSKVLKTGVHALLVIVLCNLIFTAIYASSTLIPKSKVIDSLQKSQSNQTLKAPLGSVERSTTGLGIDYGTECAAISIGLKNNPRYQDVNVYLQRFYDGYLESGANTGVFDPCSGLVELIDPNKNITQDPNLISYARNWWGMSVVIQLGILLFGLATTKIYLYILMMISLSALYYQITNYFKDWKIGILILFPFILFGDFQELQNSFPFALFTIELFISGFLIMYYLNRDLLNFKKILNLSLILGSVYNFIFWFNFHLILTFIPILIFISLFRVEQINTIYKKIAIFIIGFCSGFVFSTAIKWLISGVLFGTEIWESIKLALNTRLGTSGLNGPLADYSSSFSGFPVSFRAIVINVMVAMSKIVDPRNASFAGTIIIFAILLIAAVGFLTKVVFLRELKFKELLTALPIFLIPYFYFILTPNHSFNHAVLSYRAVPLSIGFLIGLVYLSRLRAEVVMENRN